MYTKRLIAKLIVVVNCDWHKIARKSDCVQNNNQKLTFAAEINC